MVSANYLLSCGGHNEHRYTTIDNETIAARLRSPRQRREREESNWNEKKRDG